MLRSMFSGVSGLRSHQTMMDVIGNNIANVNTAGYKGGQAVFQDLLSQVLRGGGAPTQNNGGTNPAQVGLGVRVGGVTATHTQGTTQLTNRSTDMSILGDGFFVVRSGGENLFTRLGSFSLDGQGRLVSPEGGIVQGWLADQGGQVNTNGPTGDLSIPMGQMMQPTQTRNVDLGGNIRSDQPVGAVVTTAMDITDVQGTDLPVSFAFEKTAENEWTMTATTPDPADPATPIVLATQALTFDPATGRPNVDSVPLNMAGAPGTWPDTVTANLSRPGVGSVTQFAGQGSLAALSQDGGGAGTLRSFSIGSDGTITGVFSNGRNQAIGQVALANFANPVGLERVGNTLFRSSNNSGVAQVGTAGEGGRGLARRA
jgi:flagellar hook protein FlgE